MKNELIELKENDGLVEKKIQRKKKDNNKIEH